MNAVDLFCGIGWGFACAELGIDEHGIDIEATVAKTRERLGWATTCADILDLDPADWAGVDGLIGSPPCQSWSRAGKGAGLDDPRGQLVWQPLVWALALRPRWVACEQVPEARGAFELIAHRLREVGYHSAVYELSAETFGVAQTRRRVFLTAHRDRPIGPPALTHQRYRKGRARVEPVDMLGHLPWVSMAEALGDLGPWAGAQMSKRMGRGMVEEYGDRPRRALSEPSFCLPTGSGGTPSVQWVLTGGNQLNACVRCDDEPAPTIPAHVGKNQHGHSWAISRPSTTVCADPRVSPPVHHHGSQTAGAVPWTDAGPDKPIALTEEQGCRLMGFPDGTADVLQGSKADRWRIIGNSIAVPVGTAVLRTLATPSPPVSSSP